MLPFIPVDLKSFPSRYNCNLLIYKDLQYITIIVNRTAVIKLALASYGFG